MKKQGYKQIGLTLVEVLVVIAITGVLASIAVPSFDHALEKQNLTSASEKVLVDMRWARSAAITKNRDVRVTFTTGSSWNYSVNSDPEGANTQIKTVSSSDFPTISLTTAAFSTANNL